MSRTDVDVRLRLAEGVDSPALVRLAQLDSRPLPPGPHLVVEREGRIDAALSLSDGQVVADPFRRTAALCDLLRTHAGEVRADRDHSHGGSLRRRPRFAIA